MTMDRYVSDPPLPLSPTVAAGEFSNAQLLFYDVDHSGSSFEALVFLNAPDAGVETPLEEESGFAGSFVIFGHGGCAGDAGHCDVPEAPKEPFDNRPLHPLTPQTKMVDVTAALKRATGGEGDRLTVTVLPVVPGDERPELADLLHFSAMRLVAFD
jgi:tyrosinase